MKVKPKRRAMVTLAQQIEALRARQRALEECISGLMKFDKEISDFAEHSEMDSQCKNEKIQPFLGSQKAGYYKLLSDYPPR